MASARPLADRAAPVPARRFLSVPAYLLATALVSAALPVLVIAAAAASLAPAYRGALPTLGFVLGYLWCESVGIVAAFYLWLRHRDRGAFLTGNFRLQCWWAGSLAAIARVLFRLRFHVHGAEALDGPPALLLPRHASIADTVIPMVFYAVPRQVRLRYVLKKELLLDPCLDIVGNRLPNYFVDRGGEDSERARRGVAGLTAGLGPGEGLLLYPEGTRVSAARREALARRYADAPDMLAQLERWPALLPPRLGGFLAMLDANPGRDVVFCAHAGFEGSSHFRTLVNGSWIGARIGIRFWRVPFAAIPAGRQERIDFLFGAWDRMQREVAGLAASPES